MLIILFLLELFILFLLSRRIIIGITRLIYSITRNEKSTDIIYSILFLPGTFFHEAAHFIMALFLLVPVGNIELMPQREGDSLKLGSVPIAKTDPFRRALVGTAPLIFGISAIFLGLYVAVSRSYLPGSIWVNLIAVYLIFQIGNTMFMSKQDTKGLWVVLLIAAVIIIGLYFLGVNLSVNLSDSTSQIVDKVLSQAVIYLSVPIFIDFAILGILKLFKK